jgi:hypothetical protein
MTDRLLIKCGCVAQGYLEKDGKKIPCCVVHDCTEPVEKPSLEGRTAYCDECGKEAPSSYDLAFFKIGRMVKGEQRENEDSYYCGCCGWD